MFDFLFNPQGRISRKGYLLGFLAPYLVLTLILPLIFGNTPLAGVLLIFGIFFLWPSLVSVPIRRFHDLGVTGAYQLGFIALMVLAAAVTGQGVMEHVGSADAFVELSAQERVDAMAEAMRSNSRAQLGVWLTRAVELSQYLLFGLLKGKTGSNKYGNDPLADGRGFAD